MVSGVCRSGFVAGRVEMVVVCRGQRLRLWFFFSFSFGCFSNFFSLIATLFSEKKFLPPFLGFARTSLFPLLCDGFKEGCGFACGGGEMRTGSIREVVDGFRGLCCDFAEDGFVQELMGMGDDGRVWFRWGLIGAGYW